jgi:hypothetical protein
MITRPPFVLAAAALLSALPSGVFAQTAGQTPAQTGAAASAQGTSTEAKPKKKRVTTFFDTDEPLQVTLVTNIKRIRGDKSDKAPWRAAAWGYVRPDSSKVEIPIKARTRGIWRLKNCDFPPLRLDFPNKEPQGTPFDGLNKPKLVSYCKNDDEYEQYLLQELQLYRIYNLLTPMSHRARLLHLTYADSASGKPLTTRYAIMLEEPEEMAARFEGAMIKQKGARAGDLEPKHALLVGLYSYFIANTDFSVAGLHNFELLARGDGTVIPVAYDFDFAGAVNARYATVDPSLSVTRVRDRLYRGYCASPEEYAETFALFNAKKDAIYGLYKDRIGQLMKPKIVEETLKFYDEFYKTINNPRLAKRQILDACDG